MGVYESRGQLSKAMQDLMTRWAETSLQWDDSRSRQFEERFLRNFDQDLKQASGAMEHMVTILSRIHQDCDEGT